MSHGANPFIGVTVGALSVDKIRDESKKRAFTVDEVRIVLAGVDAMAPKRLDKDHTDDVALLVKVLCYTGARPAEIIQLRACDIVTVGTVAANQIRRVAGAIKTGDAHRDIPLHPAILDLVLARAALVKGDGRLFPVWFAGFEALPPRDATSKAAGRFAGVISRLLRSFGVTDRTATIYSFRHRFRIACREAGVPGHISRVLQ